MSTRTAEQSRGSARRERLRADLVAARDEYHRALATISDEQWTMPSGNPKWTVGAVLAHIVLGLETVPLRLRAARQGRPRMRMPRVAFDFINTWLTSRLSRRHDRATIGRYFDEKHAVVLTLLDGIDGREWALVSRVYVQRFTVEEIFGYQVVHIRGHLAEVMTRLGR